MRRREFITLLGGAAAAWPLAGHTQELDRLRRVGVLMSNAASDPLGLSRVAIFRQELQELGWKEGRNLKIEVRWSGGDASRINDLSAELVKFAPDVIVANGSPVLAAMEQATRSIPIVFATIQWSKALFPAWRIRVATSPGSHSSTSPFLEGRFSCLSKLRPA
jgi:putative tryptophan/tyrosine transport system substrate-binding protein